MQLGDKKLIVQRASVGASKVITGEGADMSMFMPSIPNVPLPINIPGLQVSGKTLQRCPFSLSRKTANVLKKMSFKLLKQCLFLSLSFPLMFLYKTAKF